MKPIFAALMYQFAVVQQTSTAKLPLSFLEIKKRTCGLRVNETKPDTESAFN